MIDDLLGWAASRHRRAAVLLVCLTLAAVLPGFATLFPMDRDEPRFAQASRQMLETGDFVAIRLQDEARNKKPVGIYWMQAGAVALGRLAGVPDALSAIGLYRIPSLLGALAAVLLTYWAALPLVSRSGAVLAGAMLAGTLLLVVEAHLAKTDAVLLATVVAAMASLGRLWTARRGDPPGVAVAATFWTAVALGILVKGPITPMVPLLAAVVLSLKERSARWLLPLRPVWGLAWCLLLVLPWFILILQATGTAFFAESIGHDMAGKVVTAQESHGAPFGAYLLAFWLTGWPIAPMVLLAAPAIWRERWSDRTLFLLAWIVPTGLLFELLPTKLPHYVLPAYPAVAILAAAGLERMADGARGVRLALSTAALALVPGLLPVALVLAHGRAASTIGVTTIALAALACAAAALAVVFGVRAMRRGQAAATLAAALVAGYAVYGFVFGWFMDARRADLLALSPRLAAAGRLAVGPACAAPGFATVGDREPSLVFSTATALLMTDPPGAARFLTAGGCRVAFVVKPGEGAFLAALPPGSPVRLGSRVVGTNINGGKRLDVGVYVRGADAP